MATRETTCNISVRRDRDYSNTFRWTQELNQDIFNFYSLARENPGKGYMKRMKDLWDKKYPLHNHLSAKHLRQQAVFVEKKRNNQQGRSEIQENSVPGNQNNIKEDKTTDEGPNFNLCDNNIDLNTPFVKYYNETCNQTLSERKYKTNLIGKVSDDIFLKMNNVILDFIRNKTSLTFWDVNCIQYAAAITVLQHQGKLKEYTDKFIKNEKKPWIIEAENQINALRRKISYITSVLNQKDIAMYTKKQNKIKEKVRRMCGSLTESALNLKMTTLKHELKVSNLKLKDRITKANRSSINHSFITNQKIVYRNWKGKQITVNDKPDTQELKSFWADIWGNETTINLESDWYQDLKTTYCQNVTQKTYTLSMDIFNNYIAKIPNNKAPGGDKITSIWIKKLTSLHPELLRLLDHTLKGELEIPDWLIESTTILLPKNNDTHQAKNYRPIACLNITYKLYTKILNSFVEDHCASNNIITIEQAGGKKGLWGCTDQLLINKMVLDEVRELRRNLFVMWFDYKKAFDSVSHQWLIKAMELAKLPANLIRAITALISKWAARLQLKSSDAITVTDAIKYLTGILQGDCLSLLLFIICVNPLSFLLKKNCEGYKIGKTGNRSVKLNHLLFVDDLKTYAMNRADAKKQLSLITQFSDDIGMKFGADKCAYMNIERGQIKTLGKTIPMNKLEISELEHEDSYKYLGLDEDIAIKGDMNKNRVTKEYYNRVRKIWRSELYGRNKVQAHNVFAVPILTGTFGIVDWTKDEIAAIDIKTRKILTCTGNYHRNSNVDRLYTTRDDGGRGLNSIYDVFITRLLSLVEHLQNIATWHEYLALVVQHETDRLVRVSKEIAASLEIEEEPVTPNRKIAERAKIKIKKNHKIAWENKVQHGFVFRKQQQHQDYNSTLSNHWLKSSRTISHTEAYICAIQEQEIRTRALDGKRMNANNENFTNMCRHCKSRKEDIFHILCSCERLSASLYLPVRHNEVALTLYNTIIRNNEPEHRSILPLTSWKNKVMEIWWDKRIGTVPSVKHNRPDIVIWFLKEKECKIVDVCVPLDDNVHNQEKQKRDIYAQLSIGLKRMYPEYNYKVVPIVLGATGLITDSLIENLTELKFTKNTALQLIHQLQLKALVGSMRVVKGAMVK